MKKIKAGIAGSAGYTGGELIRLLLYHPRVDIKFLLSSSNAGNKVYQVHKDLIGETELIFTDRFDDSDIDVLFLCSGHGQSIKFLEENKVRDEVKVIDLSQDFRLEDPGYPRPFTYGLVEGEKENIRKAKNIANPGCFATCIQLGLLPLAKANLLNNEIHVSATTGSTGAGQKAMPTTQFSWRNNNFSIYKAFQHQHLREIYQSLKKWQSGFDQEINFIPYRGNFTRGILAAIYLDVDITEEKAIQIFKDFYSEHPFVSVADDEIDLKMVVGTNKCVLKVEKHGKKLLITSIVDNLVKGASGQAVQNMNVVFGMEETVGLNLKSIGF